MVVSIVTPLLVVHAEPVYKHQEFVTRRDFTVLVEYARRIVDIDPSTVMTQAHIDGQRVSGPKKIVAIHPVCRGSVCVEGRRRLALWQQYCDT